MNIMPNRIKQIDREDEVTRVNEYHWYSPMYMSRRSWTARNDRRTHNQRNFNIFVSCIMEQSVIREKMIVKRVTVCFLTALLRRILNVANRLTLLTKYVILNLETWKRYHLHPSACPSSAYRFPIQPDIFNIVVMSVLFAIPPPCLYSAQVWKLRTARQDSRFLSPVKVKLPRFLINAFANTSVVFDFNYYLFDSI